MLESLKIIEDLLSPFEAEETSAILDTFKKECPKKYELLTSMRDELKLIQLDLYKVDGFISILKADRYIYKRRIEIKKEKGQNTDLEEALLNRTNSQLQLLGVKL